MSSFRAIRDSFERLTSAHRTASAATRSPLPPGAPSPPLAEVGFRLPGGDHISPEQQVSYLSWARPFDDGTASSDYGAELSYEQHVLLSELMNQDDAFDVVYNVEMGEWQCQLSPTTPPTPRDFEERLLAFWGAGFAAGPALRLAQSQEPVPKQEQDLPSTPSPLTTVPDLPPPPATPLNRDPPPATSPLQALALEELVYSVQTELETLVRMGSKCDRGFLGLGLAESDLGPCMGQGIAKELHGRLQLEELPHLVEVEELEKHEQDGPAWEHCGIARCYAGYKVWNPGGS